MGWNYLVLAGAAAFESYSWRISIENCGGEIIGSKDPTIFTIFLEDSAGLIAAVLAFLGIWLGRTFHNAFLDPGASI